MMNNQSNRGSKSLTHYRGQADGKPEVYSFVYDNMSLFHKTLIDFSQNSGLDFDLEDTQQIIGRIVQDTFQDVLKKLRER